MLAQRYYTICILKFLLVMNHLSDRKQKDKNKIQSINWNFRLCKHVVNDNNSSREKKVADLIKCFCSQRDIIVAGKCGLEQMII